MTDNSPVPGRYAPAAPLPEDDIASLRRTFALPDLNYREIVLEETLNAAIQRWPLLRELAAQQLKDNS